MTRILGFGCALAAASLVALVIAWPLPSVSQAPKEEEPLPSEVAAITVDAPERSLYKIAVPNLRGPDPLGPQGAEVIRNDLKLVSLFNVLDQRSFIADLDEEGLGISPGAWSAVGAQGIVKGKITIEGSNIRAEMKLYELARGQKPVLERTYRGHGGKLRGFMHDFANEILRVLTGEAGAFGTRLAFARRIGPGRKDVYVADFDGHKVGRVSNGKGIAMLPSFGPGGIWYSVLSRQGMYITHSGAGRRPLIGGSGLNMGVSVCGGRAYFSSTRDGDAEIYSANLDGSDLRQLTRHPAIDVSPTCGPGGKIAFVSNRHGGPQIFTMGSNGGSPKRVTFRGEHNQTPAWCPDPKKPLIAFTGRAGGLDIFTVNLKTGEYTRLTQAQGSNKDPAFSPDCRMVAFASSRGGIYISSPEGLNHNKIVGGAAETVRWSR